jgi:predicted nucleotidyltransferase
VIARVISEEGARREHLVVSLSGSHAGGFAAPDSDVDLKAIHIARTEDLLGFTPPTLTFDRLEVIDGVEVDYTSNEIAGVLAGILGGNGNYLERVLGSPTPFASPDLASLRPLVAGALSRRLHRHYRGFAFGQRGLLEKSPSLKKLLYVIRTALTGLHALGTGEVLLDLPALAARYGLDDVDALVTARRAGLGATLDAATLAAWRPRLDDLFARLDAAHAASVLPDAPANEPALRAWLLAVRRARL